MGAVLIQNSSANGVVGGAAFLVLGFDHSLSLIWTFKLFYTELLSRYVSEGLGYGMVIR